MATHECEILHSSLENACNWMSFHLPLELSFLGREVEARILLVNEAFASPLPPFLEQQC